MSEPQGETKNLFRNTAAQSAPIVSTFIFSFVLAPIMLSRLGLAQFGVWAVTGALAQYARLLDLGVTTSLSRFVALHDAEGDRRAIEETIGVGVLAAMLVGLTVIGAAVLAAPLVSDVVGVLDAEEMRLVLVSSAAISTIYLIDGVIIAIPVGLRKMGPPNVASTAGNCVNFGFSVAALLLSTELTTYALANLAAAVVGLVFVVISLFRVWQPPFVRRPTGTRTKGIVVFGLKSQLVTLANLVSVQTDKLIIAAMLGPKTAGAYDIGNRIVQGIFSLGVLTLSALIPTATADLVKRGKRVIAEYFTRYTVRSLAIALPLFGAVCVSIPYLIVAWLGETPPNSVETVVLLSASFAVSMSTGVAMTLVVADGHPGLVAQTAGLLVVLNVSGTLLAAPLFGIWGVLVATVAAEILAAAIFLLRFHRRYSLRADAFRAAVLKPLAVTLGVAIPFALWYLAVDDLPDTRGPALIGAVATGGVYGVVCWLLESRFGLLPDRLSLDGLRRRFVKTSNAPG